MSASPKSLRRVFSVYRSESAHDSYILTVGKNFVSNIVISEEAGVSVCPNIGCTVLPSFSSKWAQYTLLQDIVLWHFSDGLFNVVYCYFSYVVHSAHYTCCWCFNPLHTLLNLLYYFSFVLRILNSSYVPFFMYLPYADRSLKNSFATFYFLSLLLDIWFLCLSHSSNIILMFLFFRFLGCIF